MSGLPKSRNDSGSLCWWVNPIALVDGTMEPGSGPRWWCCIYRSSGATFAWRFTAGYLTRVYLHGASLVREQQAARIGNVITPRADVTTSKEPLTPPAHYSGMWFVRYSRRSGRPDEVEEAETPEQAVETACLLIDEGCQVSGIGWGSLTDTVGAVEIAHLYAHWKRQRTGLQ